MSTSHEPYPDLKDWCGHFQVSLKNWRCPDCDCPISEETKERLLSAKTIAPEGHLWVFQERAQPNFEQQEVEDVGLASLFTDRSKIPSLMIRQWICSAADIREQIKDTHWYQGVYNADMFQGWDEGESRFPRLYELYLVEINKA